MASIQKKLTLDQVNLPDEVLMEILLRLPLLSLQLFKSVSKHWFSLITSEYFNRRLREPRIETPCGLFIKGEYFCNSDIYYDFATLGPKVTSFPLRATITEAGKPLEIMQTCNGLLLCWHHVSPRADYYVYNPFTEKFKNIPCTWKPAITNMILAFDPTKSPYFKVMLTETIDWDWGKDHQQYPKEDPEEDSEEDMEEDLDEDSEEDSEEDLDEDSEEDDMSSYAEQIQIYSSETSKWKICGPPFRHGTFSDLHDGIYWNNAIHWIHYDDESHYKLDIVDHNPMVTNIQTPAIENYVDYRYTKLFESRGSMLLLMQEWDWHDRYHVFEMREESSEWSVKYIIDNLHNIVPVRGIPSSLHCNPFLCIVLGERGDDSFMVIEADNNIVRYNFVSKAVSTLFDSVPSKGYQHMMPIPFIASLAGV